MTGLDALDGLELEMLQMQRMAQEQKEISNLGRRWAALYNPHYKARYAQHLTVDAEWKEEDHPRREDGKFGKGGGKSEKGKTEGAKSGIMTSATGANTFKVKGFRSKQALNNHYNKHLAEYKDDPRVKTKEDYARIALALMESPVGGDILGHVDKNNYVIRYDTKYKDFVKGNPEKGIWTMNKPFDYPGGPDEYYRQQRREDIERGGREKD